MNDYLNERNEFVIEGYDQKKPFSSFLPGISGLKGIPIWAFYANRGQGISSFGIEDKNSTILEFFPANTAYQYISTYGFRSFVKLKGEKVYEPFAPTEPSDHISRKMVISNSEFSIEEINKELGLRYHVTYYGLPNESIGALIRKVTIESLSTDVEVEILDGLATIIPYGVTNSSFKEMSNLMKSWMEVFNLENRLPYFTVRASTGDEAEVSTVSRGHFYLSYADDGELILPIVDPKVVFGINTALNYPSGFDNIDFDHINAIAQVTVNQVPCAFTPIKTTLIKGEVLTINTIIGHAQNIEVLQDCVSDLVQPNYMDVKRYEASKIIEDMLGEIETKTSNKVLDAYIKQSYLDNLLRGGHPILLKGEINQFVYYVYSRKHGDPEREYNFFKLAPEFYSSGEGNFRDVNQNRRSDIYFNTEVGTYNIKLFMDLIQLDGYNPLVVQGSEFVLKECDLANELVHEHLHTHQEAMSKILKGKFTPGKIINFIQNNNVNLKTNEESLIKDVIDHAIQTEEARHSEGFWSDHFTYNLDLIEAYLDIFPDQLEVLLFDDEGYRFFNSIETVLPRSQKYVLTNNNQVRQYGAAIKDLEKIKALNLDPNGANWVTTSNGVIFETNLYIKLLVLAVTKFSLLDPMGMGIEMEGNKPGWNDAMNGLPGLMGSGLGETFEVQRIHKFLMSATQHFGNHTVNIPTEIFELLTGIHLKLQENLDDFCYWDGVATLREVYREKSRFGLEGSLVSITLSEIEVFLEKSLIKLQQGLKRAKAMGNGLFPTFFKFTAEACDVIKDSDEQPCITHYGLPAVKIHHFKGEALPYFLEGPARYLKVTDDIEEAREIHLKVKASGIYDKKLGMYKTSESLESENHEIGRIRAFTPGWLERESVFLHMSYKYLLGLISAGLYDEFYEAMKTNFVPFMDPEVYGRSILENCSFLASSVNPDPQTHGQGFVARLSGSNAEVLSLWYKMMIGRGGFNYSDQLTFKFAPILSAELFDEHGEVTFKYLNKTMITYVNKTGKNTYGINNAQVKGMTLYMNKDIFRIEGNVLYEGRAELLRKGEIQRIVIHFV